MERTVVTYWEKWGGHELAAVQRLVDAFNSSQARFEVVVTQAGDWASSPDMGKIERARREGELPDLLGLEDRHVPDLAAEGALLPFEPVEWLSDAGFHPGFLGLATQDGRVYGLPLSADIATLYVNASVAGADIPCEIGAFRDMLGNMKQKGLTGFAPVYPGWWPHAWVWFFGGDWFDGAGRFTPARPENVAAYEWVLSLKEFLPAGAYNRPLNPLGAPSEDAFMQGHVGMVFDGDWIVARLAGLKGFDWYPAGFPSVDATPCAVIQSDLVCVPNGARCPEGALAFLRYASDPSRLEDLAIAQFKISPLAEWSKHFFAEHPNPRLDRLHAILANGRLFHDPRVPGWMGCMERIQKAFAFMWAGEKTPAAVLGELEMETRKQKI